MLARLDQELAPLRSAVDREGTLLRLDGPGGQSSLAVRVPEIVGEMGYLAERFAGSPQVARWFGLHDAEELSEEEARVLAQRLVEDLAAEGVVERPQRLFEPLRAALLRTFRSAARTGTVDPPDVGDVGLGSVLAEDEVRRVRLWIERALGGPAARI